MERPAKRRAVESARGGPVSAPAAPAAAPDLTAVLVCLARMRHPAAAWACVGATCRQLRAASRAAVAGSIHTLLPAAVARASAAERAALEAATDATIAAAHRRNGSAVDDAAAKAKLRAARARTVAAQAQARRALGAVRWLCRTATPERAAGERVAAALVLLPRVSAGAAGAVFDATGLQVSWAHLLAAARARVPGFAVWVTRPLCSFALSLLQTACVCNGVDMHALSHMLPFVPPEELLEMLEVAVGASSSATATVALAARLTQGPETAPAAASAPAAAAAQPGATDAAACGGAAGAAAPPAAAALAHHPPPCLSQAMFLQLLSAAAGREQLQHSTVVRALCKLPHAAAVTAQQAADLLGAAAADVVPSLCKCLPAAQQLGAGTVAELLRQAAGRSLHVLQALLGLPAAGSVDTAVRQTVVAGVLWQQLQASMAGTGYLDYRLGSILRSSAVSSLGADFFTQLAVSVMCAPPLPPCGSASDSSSAIDAGSRAARRACASVLELLHPVLGGLPAESAELLLEAAALHVRCSSSLAILGEMHGPAMGHEAVERLLCAAVAERCPAPLLRQLCDVLVPAEVLDSFAAGALLATAVTANASGAVLGVLLDALDSQLREGDALTSALTAAIRLRRTHALALVAGRLVPTLEELGDMALEVLPEAVRASCHAGGSSGSSGGGGGGDSSPLEVLCIALAATSPSAQLDWFDLQPALEQALLLQQPAAVAVLCRVPMDRADAAQLAALSAPLQAAAAGRLHVAELAAAAAAAGMSAERTGELLRAAAAAQPAALQASCTWALPALQVAPDDPEESSERMYAELRRLLEASGAADGAAAVAAASRLLALPAAAQLQPVHVQLLLDSAVPLCCLDACAKLCGLPGAARAYAYGASRLLHDAVLAMAGGAGGQRRLWDLGGSQLRSVCRLPACQRLQSSEVASLLLTATTLGLSIAVELLCRLPGAAAVPPGEAAALLHAALAQGSCCILARLTRLPGAQALAPHMLLRLLRVAACSGRGSNPSAGLGRRLQLLCGLSSAARAGTLELPASALVPVFEAAVGAPACERSRAVSALCGLPAAAGLEAAQLAAWLLRCEEAAEAEEEDSEDGDEEEDGQQAVEAAPGAPSVCACCSLRLLLVRADCGAALASAERDKPAV